MTLLTDAAADTIRAQLGALLAHRYTRTPITQGAEDAWGDAVDVPGTPVPSQPCLYSAVRRLRAADGSRETVDEPNLRVPVGDPLAVGDRVSDITDGDGAVLAAGPFTVDTLEPIAGLGPTLQLRATLRAAAVAE